MKIDKKILVIVALTTIIIVQAFYIYQLQTFKDSLKPKVRQFVDELCEFMEVTYHVQYVNETQREQLTNEIMQELEG